MKNNTFLGLIAGVVLTLFIFFVMTSLKVVKPQGEGVIAQVGTQTLTQKEAKALMPEAFIAVENDEYALLEGMASRWLANTVLEKEAKSKNMSLEKYLAKEIWPKGIAKGSINEARKQRLAGYEVAREKKIEELKKKYRAKVLLKKPETYVPGIAVVASNGVREQKQVKGSRSSSPMPGKGAPSIGSSNAPIKMIEYADFHCGYCKRAHGTTQKILDAYGDKIQLVFKHYPLSNSPGSGSYLTHEASTCAQEQGQFWEYHHKIMESSRSPGRTELLQFAKDLKLNSSDFETCLSSGRYRDVIRKDKEEGSADGVSGTPAFRINGKKVDGAYPYNHFKGIIEGILDPSKKQPEPVEKKPAPPKRIVFNDLAGKPSKGPDNAAVTIVEFSDFHCPFCERVNPTLKKIMEDYAGKVRVVWRHYPLSFHAGAEVTHQASECARDQGEDYFWKAHDLFFENVGGYKNSEDYVQAAKTLGLDSEKFKECIESKKYASRVNDDLAKGDEVGVSGTPAFFINGESLSGAQPYSVFKAAVERALDPSKPAAPKAPKKPEKVEFDDLDGKPMLGPANAKVTIVEFSDFHCPFCVRVGPSLKKLMTNYSGKVRRVWRHFPLSIHPGAEITHEASECAHDQGKFWEYKEKVFENISSHKSKEALESFARDLGLDESKFKTCLDSRKHKAKVESDIAKGKTSGVRGTPAVFINGQHFAGAYPYETFEAVVKRELDA